MTSGPLARTSSGSEHKNQRHDWERQGLEKLAVDFLQQALQCQTDLPQSRSFFSSRVHLRTGRPPSSYSTLQIVDANMEKLQLAPPCSPGAALCAALCGAAGPCGAPRSHHLGILPSPSMELKRLCSAPAAVSLWRGRKWERLYDFSSQENNCLGTLALLACSTGC